jgi:hypothetical protein
MPPVAAASAPASAEFLVLLLEAGRFATYVGLMKVEGWSIGEVRPTNWFRSLLAPKAMPLVAESLPQGSIDTAFVQSR